MTHRRALDAELSNIRDDILRMGSFVYRMTQQAVKAFMENNHDLARTVIEGDDEVDKIHRRVENRVTATVALQQPMASDLRYLMSVLFISNELERMADHAVGICKTILRYQGSAPIETAPAILQMLETIRTMIYESMDAFIADDEEHVRKIAEKDSVVDALYASLFKGLVEKMQEEEVPVEQGTYILWTAHNLERIGDRATNICERILYANTGKVKELNTSPPKPKTE